MTVTSPRLRLLEYYFFDSDLSESFEYDYGHACLSAIE